MACSENTFFISASVQQCMGLCLLHTAFLGHFCYLDDGAKWTRAPGCGWKDLPGLQHVHWSPCAALDNCLRVVHPEHLVSVASMCVPLYLHYSLRSSRWLDNVSYLLVPIQIYKKPGSFQKVNQELALRLRERRTAHTVCSVQAIACRTTDPTNRA